MIDLFTFVGDGFVAIGAEVLMAASILLVLVFAVDWLLSLGSTTLQQSAMWNACLVTLILLPCLAVFVPPIYLPAFASPRLVNGSDDRPEVQADATAPLLAASAPRRSVISPTKNEARLWGMIEWQMLLAGVYLVGLVVGCGKLMRGVGAARQLRSAAHTLDSGPWKDGLDLWAQRILGATKPGIAHSAQIQVPLVIGFRHPTILIPSPIATSEDFSSHIDSVLCHELAHIGRADHRWLILLRFVRIVYWFHPLVWCVERRVAQIRERACDEYCMYVGDSDQYIDTLLELASFIVRPARLSVGLAAVRTPRITLRLHALRTTQGASSFMCGVASRSGWTVCLVLAGLLISGCQPSKQTVDTGTAEELTRAVDELRDQMKSLGNEIATYKKSQGPSDEDIPYLEQLVAASEAIHARIQAKYQSGAPGGEVEQEAAARLHLHLAKAQLALAKDDAVEAVQQYEEAVLAAEDKVVSVEAAFDAGAIVLDLLLQAQVERARTKAQLSKTKKEIGE